MRAVCVFLTVRNPKDKLICKLYSTTRGVQSSDEKSPQKKLRDHRNDASILSHTAIFHLSGVRSSGCLHGRLLT